MASNPPQPYQQPPTATQNAEPAATADMPPSMASKRQVTADELFTELNRYPLFMTQLPDPSSQDTDSEAAAQLEGLRALAYEGTRAEIASNFKNQGNEAVAEKRWIDAREYYGKAIVALHGPKVPHNEDFDPEGGLGDMRVEEIEDDDEEAEEKRERGLEEACLANRALCQLEMKNYASTLRDCASALKLNPRNSKAWYRAATASLALDKPGSAIDACTTALKYDPKNAALQTLLTKAQAREKIVVETARKRAERESRVKKETETLQHAFLSRGIKVRSTESPPDMEDAAPSLATPTDASSTLSLPLIFLYPLAAQSDFVKSCAEHESLGEHLAYILPVPWDDKGEYTAESVECYIETREGGLVKAGKKLSLLKVLGGGKVEVVDGLVAVNVVPKERVGEFVGEFKRRKGKA